MAKSNYYWWFTVVFIFNIDKITSQIISHAAVYGKNATEESTTEVQTNETDITTERPAVTLPEDVLQELQNAATDIIPEDHLENAVPCGNSGKNVSRIVGGADTEPGEFPWIVSIQISHGAIRRHICGGAIINDEWVVTAAHCVFRRKAEIFSIVAGDYDLNITEEHEQRVQAKRIILKNYDYFSFNHDIALIQVAEKFKMDAKWISPICLMKQGRVFLTGNATVAGWGRLKEDGLLPNILQSVTLPIIRYSKCRALYRSAGIDFMLNDCNICCGYLKGGADSCQGDSGGPLMCIGSDKQYYLCGIVSWGLGCARPNYPGIYTMTSCYTSWIKQTMDGENSETFI